ncbi:MAG: polysaccharide pyruvyl transferase family protein [Aquificae bacterium]|nr:polysaccharide pyruvyl transferase family protein [Aquificota bacterium]
MEKVGILTTFDELNPGAFLQAYSLYRVIEDLGYVPILIHHKTIPYLAKEFKIYFLNKNPVYIMDNIIKYHKFRSLWRHLQISPLFFSLESLNKYLENESIKTVVLGSDEIWNFKNAIGANIPAFWGYGLNRVRLLTYAVSFGSVSMNDKFPNFVIKGLSKVRQFLARDFNTKNILEQKFSKPSLIVLDPTFLWNFEDDAFVRAYSKIIINKDKKYCIVYGFFDSVWGKYILDFCTTKGLTPISLFYRNNWCKVNIIRISPFDWIKFFKKAEFIITNMYHGIIFALKYKKNFIFQLTPYRLNKISTLIKLFDIDRSMVESPQGLYNHYDYNTTLDYGSIDRKINELKNKSLNALLSSLQML